jgi:type II secretory pathway pseudopilin PulG
MDTAVSNYCRKASGFTLIELMLANLVLMVGLLSVAAMVLYALSLHFTSRVEAAAFEFSQQKLEELKSLPLDSPLLVGPGNTLDADFDIDFYSDPVPQFTLENEMVLNVTRDTRVLFETRWNITDFGSQKVITVSTRSLASSFSSLKPISLRVLKGF